jgi:hypothetical protein
LILVIFAILRAEFEYYTENEHTPDRTAVSRAVEYLLAPLYQKLGIEHWEVHEEQAAYGTR